MKTTKPLSRRLRMEPLESRTLLSTLMKPGDTHFWSGIDGEKNVIQADFVAPPADPDGDPRTETALHVFINVGMALFHQFATTQGAQALPTSGGEAMAKWFTIPVGTTGNFSVSLKSLDEVFAQSPDFRKNMTGHLLYATNVTILWRPKIDGQWQLRDYKDEEYYVSRFVSALDRNELSGQPAPTDVIPFEMTAFDPTTLAVNGKVLQVIAPTRHAPTLTVQSTGTPPVFWDNGGTNGKHFLQYSPRSHSQRDQGTIVITRAGKAVGTIGLVGYNMTPHTWYVDRAALVNELISNFDGGAKYEQTHPGHFQRIADNIIAEVESVWGKYAKRASSAAADLQITLDQKADGASTNLDRLQQSDFFRDLLALKHHYSNLNVVAYSYHMGELLRKLDSLLASAPVQMVVDVGWILHDVGMSRDPAQPEQAIKALGKTLAHELGHAHGFTGHIIPNTLVPTLDPYDLMQQNRLLYNTSFSLRESAPYFSLMLGRGWQIPDHRPESNNVKKALDTITLSPAMPLFRREHYPFENTTSQQTSPWVWVADARVAEHLKTLSVSVTLAHPSDQVVSVQYATGPRTGPNPADGGKDYSATKDTLTWKPGEPLTKTFAVPILDDTRDEYDEAFQVNLSASINAAIGRGTAVCTILDNDVAPSLSVQAASLAEHLKSMTVTVKLSAASDKLVTVKYATANGTGTYKAEAGKDYSATTGTLTWKPGESLTKTFTVPILDDSRDEYDETFQVQLSAPMNAEISRGTAVVTILDNDVAPSLSVQNASLAEHLKSMTVTVKLSAASDKLVTVKYATANGTGTYKAEAGKDYSATTGTLTWKPGESLTKTFSIPVLDDNRDEPNETFQVNLSAPTNATIGRTIGVCTILDNDPAGARTSASSSNAAVVPAAVQPAASQLLAGKTTRTAAISRSELAPAVSARARDQGLSGVDNWRLADLDLSWASVQSQRADESPEKGRRWSSALLDDLASGTFASALLRHE